MLCVCALQSGYVNVGCESVRFCVDTLSIVDTCFLLVVKESFLCTQVVSVLVHLFSVGCHLLICCLSLLVGD